MTIGEQPLVLLRLTAKLPWCIRMIRSRISLFIAFLSASLALAQKPAPAASNSVQKVGAHDAELLLASKCQVFRTTADFPNQLKTALKVLTEDGKLDLANPGDPFQVGDVVVDRTLPARRLVLAGKCQNLWFIHYEQGGIGRSDAVVFFQGNSRGQLSFAWGGRGFTQASSIDDLRNAIAKKLFRDDLPFYW